MKRLLIVAFLFLGQMILGQTSLDPKMFGSWKGSEKDQQIMGVEKHWIQHRFEDGTYIILFTVVEDGEVTTSSEKGKWWIENGDFHELHSGSKAADVYTYKFLDDDHVQFRVKSTKSNFENPEYQFIDTRLLEDSL